MPRRPKLVFTSAEKVAAVLIVLDWIGPSPAQANNFSRFTFWATCAPELGYFDFSGIGIGADNVRDVPDETKWIVGASDGVYDAALLYDFGPSQHDPDRYVCTNRIVAAQGHRVP